MPESSSFFPARLVSRVLAGATDIRRGEGRAVLASGLLFFLVLAAIMVLRPVREAMGLQKGIKNVRTLFLYTVVITLLLVPGFGYLVSRVRRRVFLTVSFRCAALILLVFCLSLTVFPERIARAAEQIYYVYHSVFNLFVVSIFWAFMADLFSISESKRLFPAIAVGGTLGAIAASMLSWMLSWMISWMLPAMAVGATLGAIAGSTICGLVSWMICLLPDRIGAVVLFVVAVALLELAARTAALVARTRSTAKCERTQVRPIGGHALAGFTALLRSRYLLGIVLLILTGAVISTFFYFTGLRIVEEAVPSVDQRTVLFAQINLWAQVGTLFAQAFLAGRIMRLVGVGSALAALPLTAVGGFAVLAAAPVLTAYVIVNATYRAVQRGIARPARETLFTVVTREEKYKAKSLLDTVGFRAGDATGAQLEGALGKLGWGVTGLGLAVVPLTLFWAALSLLLGRAQSRLASGTTRRSV